MASTTRAVAGLLSLAVLLLMHVADASGDPYQILGVSRDATDQEIKRVFKKLARKHHPDALKGDHTEAEKERARKYFMELSAAYETLSSEEKRKALDEGRRVSSVDRNYLRYNLFSDDFTGAQAKGTEVKQLLEGKGGSGIVFFWSPNYPDCIDAGLNFKKAAQSLDITDITVFSFRCDDDPSVCHIARLGDLPIIMVLTPNGRERYQGKFEPYSITEFALEKAHLGVAERAIAPDAWDVCPNPEDSIKDKLAPYFLPTSKKCTLGSITNEFVSFEYSRCYDCEVETKLARGLLGRVLPTLVLRRLDCGAGGYEDFCEDLGLRSRDRAWTVASVTKRCWWAMKRPYVFSNEECEPLKVTRFDGKYKAWEFVRFIMSRKKSHAIRLAPSDIPTVKSRDTAYAILYHSTSGADDEVILRWSFLAREVNTYRPVVGKRGFPLKLAAIACETAQSCGVNALPVVMLYGYGSKVKQLPPVEYGDLRSLRGLYRRILHDVEPLHLHRLTPSSYNQKVGKAAETGKYWLVLFNAGDWCPPCNQIRPEWDPVARLVQEGEFAKKLSVGVVDCDAHGPLCQKLGLQGFPTTVFIPPKGPRVDFNGDRNAEAIVNWATDMIDNKLLKIGGQELGQRHQRGETMLVSFTAGAWCPPCTALGPTFKKVANKLDFPVIQINCDQDRYTCNNFGVDGYPTIKLFSAGRNLDYQGDKNVDLIANWATRMK